MTTTDTTTTVKKPNYRLRAMVVVLGLVVAMSLLVEQARPANAAFPGANGKIVFQSDRATGPGVDNPTRDPEIFTMNKDGTGLTQLTNNTEQDYSPSFSADGSTIAFTSNRDGNKEIYVMDSDGKNQTRLTNNSTEEDYPTISPNGYTVAYESVRGGSAEIILWVAGFEANLTKNAAYDTNPAFSPDGKMIAFESSRDGNSEVYVMDTDSGTNDAKNLSNNQDVDGTPDWSPDGSKIAFSSNRADNYNIFVMNADGSSQKRLTKVINNSDVYPAWSPNGKKIAFMSTRGGGDQEIFTMKAKPEGERNRPKNLTKDDDNVQDYLPDWQPLVN